MNGVVAQKPELPSGHVAVEGGIDVEGYAECRHCRRDFWVWVRIREDKVSDIVVNKLRKGYIPDNIRSSY